MQNAADGISDRVRGIAAEKRYTHEQVARLLSLSRTSVSARMNGRVPFTGPELHQLALELNVDVGRFFPAVASGAER